VVSPRIGQCLARSSENALAYSTHLIPSGFKAGKRLTSVPAFDVR
jgi:hypothetical protein